MITSHLIADISQVISYQGRVTDSGGTPVVDGSYQMTFRIMDAPAGGSVLWNSGNQSIPVSNGVFNVLLGESPQPTLNLSFDEDYWLLVTFEGTNQTPRQRMASSGYSYMASGLVAGTEVIGSVETDTKAAIKATNTSTVEETFGVYGSTATTLGYGVVGVQPGYDPVGDLGTFWKPGGFFGGRNGVVGFSKTQGGFGVLGLSQATSGSGYGGYFSTDALNGTGVYGYARASSGTTYGVYGQSNSTEGAGVFGYASAVSGDTYGGRFESFAAGGTGVYGRVWSTEGATSNAVYGVHDGVFGRGVGGLATATSGINYGITGETLSTMGCGVMGDAIASTGTTYGIWGLALSSGGFGGYFTGDVHVQGALSKTSGSFLIDHPLDPENKLLRHNFVESPENLLIYRGKVHLDAEGKAEVAMPEYFEALAKEDQASIHLTPVGALPFLVSGEWNRRNNSFTIFGDPGRDVYWEVLAERDDPSMRRLMRPVEEEKGPNNKYCDRGKLLDPVAYGYPESMGRDYERRERDRLRLEEIKAEMKAARSRPDIEHP